MKLQVSCENSYSGGLVENNQWCISFIKKLLNAKNPIVSEDSPPMMAVPDVVNQLNKHCILVSA